MTQRNGRFEWTMTGLDRYPYRLTRNYAVKLQWCPDETRVIEGPAVILRGASTGERWVRLVYGELHVHKSYCWDGPSGPAIDTTDFMRASLVHDALYQLIEWGAVPARPWRAAADRELLSICREDGMPTWRAYYAYAAVRLFGAAHLRNH